MGFGSDLLCDLLEMLNLINIGSAAIATHRNLVDRIQQTNMRGLMAERFRAFDLHTGAINHSRGVLHGSYKKSLPCGVFTGAIKNHSRAVSHRNYFAWRK
jgi:hypothetical protein